MVGRTSIGFVGGGKLFLLRRAISAFFFLPWRNIFLEAQWKMIFFILLLFIGVVGDIQGQL